MFYSFLTSPQIVGLSMQPVLLPNHYNSHFNMYVYMYTFLGIESRTIIFDKSSNLPYLIIIIVKGASISQHYFASYHFSSSSLFKSWDALFYCSLTPFPHEKMRMCYTIKVNGVHLPISFQSSQNKENNFVDLTLIFDADPSQSLSHG